MTVFHILCILINLLQCSCDVCVNGPPELQNLRKETDLLMQVIAAHHASKYRTGLYDDDMGTDIKHERYMGKLNLRMIVSKIREQVGSLLLSACVKFLQWHLRCNSNSNTLFGDFHTMAMDAVCSLKNLWQPNFFGGKALFESWKVKATSKRVIKRYKLPLS